MSKPMTAADTKLFPVCGEPPAADRSRAFARARQHVDLAAWRLGLEDGMRHILRTPQRQLTVQLPVRHDDGRLATYTGFRVQHSLARGPVLGGLRYCAELTLEDICAVAMRATWQCAAANLPFGGAAGGVLIDPGNLSPAELERVTRRYATEIAPLLGRERDILAAGAGTSPDVIAWAMDTFSMQRGHTVPAVAVGKPLAVGGSQGHDLGARGVVAVLREVAAARGIDLHGARAVVAGAAPGEQALVPLMRDLGASVAELPAEAALGHHCDILLLGGQVPVLGAVEALEIRADLVVEAGGMVDVEADWVLEARGATVIPDVLTGAGQVAASYFEWVQGLQQFLWTSREVYAQLDRLAADAARQALQIADARRLSLRAGVLVLAVGRVVEAIVARGIYP